MELWENKSQNVHAHPYFVFDEIFKLILGITVLKVKGLITDHKIPQQHLKCVNF